MFNVVELMEFIVMIFNHPEMSNTKLVYLKPLQARSYNALNKNNKSNTRFRTNFNFVFKL